LEDQQVPGARLTRQELKSQDEITSSLQRMMELLETWKKEILIAVGAAAVITVAVLGWRAYSGSRNAAASVQLSAAITAFEDQNTKPDKARYEKAAAEAQKTIDGYGSTSAAIIARYYLALSQERLGDAATAEKNMQDVVTRGDGTIKGVAQFALAHIQAQHSETPKAIETLTQLYSSGNYPRSAVAFELASLYETSGQKDKAQEYYGKVITDSPDSHFRQDSESALKRMGLPVPAPPAPVAPPAPAPAKK
jgi:predicted negative regulator of RcsB-dependent stress response